VDLRARGSDARISAAIQLPYTSVFVITFRKNVDRVYNLTILYNLREKSSFKIKNRQSYSNPRDLNHPFERSSPVVASRERTEVHIDLQL
jgi:hypothetical protein